MLGAARGAIGGGKHAMKLRMQRAVDLTAGKHRVVWRFAPKSVKRGLSLSLGTLLAALGYVVVTHVRAVRRRSWIVKCGSPCFTRPSATFNAALAAT